MVLGRWVGSGVVGSQRGPSLPPRSQPPTVITLWIAPTGGLATPAVDDAGSPITAPCLHARGGGWCPSWLRMNDYGWD